MLPYKPYAFLNEGGTLTYDFFVDCPVGTLPAIYSVDNSISDRVIHTYKLSSAGGGVQSKLAVSVGSTKPKLVIKIIDASSNLKGSFTVLLVGGKFSAPAYKPYMYLQFLSTTNSKIYFRVDFGTDKYQLPSTPTLVANTATKTYSLLYELVDISNPGGVQESNYDLSAAPPSNYKYVDVILMKNNSVKGKGTTDQADADASGDS